MLPTIRKIGEEGLKKFLKQMIDKNIKKFCQLIPLINEINDRLDKESSSFYDGGHSFEDCNKSDFDELGKYQEELKHLLVEILELKT